MEVIEKIRATVEPSLEDMGYRIVLLKLTDSSKTKTLLLMAERKDDVMMSFDDCTDISRTVSALLDVEDPITGNYNLEVSSPGVDRPLTRLEDYTRYKGYEAKLETYVPQDGRKRFRGLIENVKGETIEVNMPEGRAELAYSNIRNAKLVMTDELFAEHLRKQKKKQSN